MSGFYKSTEACGARFIEYEDFWVADAFGDNITEEYWACRQRVAALDLSMVRKFDVWGPGAAALLQATVTRDLARLADGRVAYSAMCREDGGMIDDGTVFRFDDQHFRWAGYVDSTGPWLLQHAERLGLDVTVEPVTSRLHNMAVQGPKSRDVLAGLFWALPGKPAVADLSWFGFTEARLGSESGPPALVSRTGYSGELGYEVWCQPEDGAAVWEAVWSAGQAHGIRGLGFQALDPLRIEAGLIAQGTDYEAGLQDPFEAGIGFTVSMAKADDYVGKDALARRRAEPTERFVGLEIDLPDVPEETAVTDDGAAGQVVGAITSAARSAILDKTIAFARVRVSHSEPGTGVHVGSAHAVVVPVPFYDPDKTKPRS